MRTDEANLDIGAKINIQKLIDSRLLVQGNSGSGKSYFIRNLLEQSNGKILSIILDIEGEYHTLREKYDYLLIGGENSDVRINSGVATLLPKKILELKVSTIIDLSDLKRPERIQYVKQFLNGLMELPKKYWQPCLVVVEEAHQYCGQQEKQDSTWAVIDLMTRGRKRGFCGILVTQRISKLHKDAAAECNNKFIGRTYLDIDMKRAAEELGFTSKQDMLKLRDLNAGDFFAFGVAITPHHVHRVSIKQAETTHPKVGMDLKGKIEPPTERVKQVLSQLKELPQEQVKELKEKQDYVKRIRELEFELRRLPKQQPIQDWSKIKELKESYDSQISDLQQQNRVSEKKASIYEYKVQQISKIISVSLPKQEFFEPPEKKVFYKKISYEPEITNNTYGNPENVSGGAMRMLKATASFFPKPTSKQRMATIAGLSYKSGSFNTYLSTLKREGLIEQQGMEFIATKEGMNLAGDVTQIPSDSRSLIQMWTRIIKGGASRILKALADAYPNSLSKEEIGNRTGLAPLSGSFNTYLSTLKRNGLIEKEGSSIRISKELAGD